MEQERRARFTVDIVESEDGTIRLTSPTHRFDAIAFSPATGGSGPKAYAKLAKILDVSPGSDRHPATDAGRSEREPDAATEPPRLVALYDPQHAEGLASFFVECASMRMTMVAGDPSPFVGPDEHAGAVIVGADELAGEGSWSGAHIKELARMAGIPADRPGTEWAKCPECGHEHYDGRGGVPCAEPGCSCQRSWLPRADE